MILHILSFCKTIECFIGYWTKHSIFYQMIMILHVELNMLISFHTIRSSFFVPKEGYFLYLTIIHKIDGRGIWLVTSNWPHVSLTTLDYIWWLNQLNGSGEVQASKCCETYFYDVCFNFMDSVLCCMGSGMDVGYMYVYKHRFHPSLTGHCKIFLLFNIFLSFSKVNFVYKVPFHAKYESFMHNSIVNLNTNYAS